MNDWTQKTMSGWSEWKKQPFWKARWPYKLHIFSRVKRVKKYATSKAIWPWKKAVFSRGSAIHSFERQKSFMNFKINVEHECLWFARVLWNQIGLLKAIVVAFILWESTNLSIFGKKSLILWQKITTFVYFWPLKASHALLWPFKGLMRPI